MLCELQMSVRGPATSSDLPKVTQRGHAGAAIPTQFWALLQEGGQLSRSVRVWLSWGGHSQQLPPTFLKLVLCQEDSKSGFILYGSVRSCRSKCLV